MIKWTDRLVRAKDYARAKHDSIGQKRKGSGLPYWVHTEAVAVLVSTVTQDEDIIIAAFGHDLLEDVPYLNFSDLVIEFGNRAAELILEVTNEYTSESYPNLNRRQRKQGEAYRLRDVSQAAKIIKLADIISNLSDILDLDKHFAVVYLREKEILIDLIRDGNDKLYQIAKAKIARTKELLNIPIS